MQLVGQWIEAQDCPLAPPHPLSTQHQPAARGFFYAHIRPLLRRDLARIYLLVFLVILDFLAYIESIATPHRKPTVKTAVTYALLAIVLTCVIAHAVTPLVTAMDEAFGSVARVLRPKESQ